MLLSPVRGRGWVRGYRGSFGQRDLDCGPYAFRILDDFVGPESNDSPSLTLHDGCAMSIRFHLERVMLAVDLNNELPRHAGEVCEIRPDRMLSAEFYAV